MSSDFDLTMTVVSCANLPTEILINIFLYLSFSDILAARLCCKKWFDIINEPQFVSQRTFEIKGGELCSNHPATEVASASKIQNLCLDGIKFGDVDELFRQIGPDLKTLTLDYVPIVDALRLTFAHFTNLQSLKVNLIMMPNLLENFENRLIGNLSQLKELKLTINDSRVNKYLLHCSMSADSLEKLTLEVTEEIEVETLKILDTHAGTLKLLDLSFYQQRTLDISQWTIIAIKLSLLSLSLRKKFPRSIIVEMVKSQKSLRSLCLDEFARDVKVDMAKNRTSLFSLCVDESNIVDDECLTLIVQKLPQLERLTLDGCKLVTDIGMEHLTKLLKLTALSVKTGSKITPDDIRSIVGQEANIRLQELHMAGIRRLDQNAVSFCAKNLPRLIILELGECGKAVTYKSVMEIFKHQRNLRDLRLESCSKFKRLETTNPNCLKLLGLSGCEQLSDEALSAIRVPHLKFIDIRGCLRVTNTGISNLIKNCAAIEEIAFTYSNKMYEQLVDVLIKRLGRLRTLIIEDYREPMRLETTDWKRTRLVGGTSKLRTCL